MTKPTTLGLVDTVNRLFWAVLVEILLFYKNFIKKKNPAESRGYIKETDIDILATILSIVLTGSQKLSLHFVTSLSQSVSMSSNEVEISLGFIQL